jgi:hypothetical protein
METNQATGPHQPASTPERSSRIWEVHQNKAPDSSVEAGGDTIELLCIALCEADIGEAGLRNASRGRGHRFRVALNTNHLTLAPNKPCCKHRNIASARTQVRHPHSSAETRSTKDTLGQRIK